MSKTFATDRTGLVGKAFDAPLINCLRASIEARIKSMQNNLSARVSYVRVISQGCLFVSGVNMLR